MPDPGITPNEFDAIEAEQVKAYFNDADDLNWAGALVFSLMVYAVHDASPWWTWGPALGLIYLITLVRTFLIRQYRRKPEYRSSTQWIHSQAASGGLAGVVWGVSSTAMLAYLPVTLQLFVLTVLTVVAASAMSESVSLVLPPRFFTIASISPPALWLLTVGDRLHLLLAVLLLLFIPVEILLGSKKHRIFIEVQRLRFRNESLVAELSRQHEMLESASKAKSRFLAAASHDLRQPLAALMIFLEQLEFERQLSSSGKDVLDHAQQATASLCSLLDGLLDISRLDGQSIRLKIKSFAIQNIFDELGEEFRPIAEQKGIRLKFSPSSAVIESDIILTVQILRNLISNALRYTPSGHVLVGCRHRNGRLAIEVHDTGIGIPEDQLARIFDEFYQVNNPERDRQQGLGLGLSIVERAARLLGHPVALTSKPGKGSTFSVTVPLAKAAIIEERIDQVRAEDTPELADRLIAVIENEGSIRAGMQSLIQSWGCRVVVADSATTMIKQLETMDETVELIISDFGLKGSMNGVDAIAAIRQRWGDRLPALLFTGNISKETYTLARDSRLPILYKPAKAEALREAISVAFCNSKFQAGHV
ncbi:MAG: hybrid sensor histidine kinase/response regulator [Gammaproteobacteria bacterium]|nr:hybrid sensor histidine kinase/response regulator [Gammaproteobacteria bacterium]MBU1775527.1 hybrid sensor histidine kinase/response regulator [Gammaproteobacteria bacterium]MBU1968676.1 hybrid sensor histidine kinase/response regulator [Gammaproteobacteria bacterium]